MQRERVQDQYPWTWEIPLAVACAMLSAWIGASQLGRAVANWFAGAGWRWPAPDKLLTSLPGLLAGDAAAGLPGIHHAANTATLWGCLIGVDLVVAMAFTPVGLVAWRRWGPGRMRGMATITEAHELLGRDRLWKARHVVRPDLYPARRKARR